MGPVAPTVPAEISSATAVVESAQSRADSGGAIEAAIPWAPTWGMMLGLTAVCTTAALFAQNGAGRGMFIEILCLGTLLMAAAFDSASGRIPNPLTYTALLIGLALNLLDPLAAHVARPFHDHWLGTAGWIQSLEGLLLFGGIGLLSRLISAIGGGDMKLLAALGALLGRSLAIDALLCGLVIAVVYSLTNLLSAGRLNMGIRFLSRKALSAIYPRVKLPVAEHGARIFPLAIPIFVGLLCQGLPPVSKALGWLLGP